MVINRYNRLSGPENVIAIIPARGGSKRIPRKNIRDFCGKPMIAWPIKAALDADLFTNVIVSTDDDEIAEIAIHFGAEVPFLRPAILATDYTPTTDVILHALKKIEEMGASCKFVFCIYATNPFLQMENLRRGYHLLAHEDSPSAFPVTTYSSSIYRSWRIVEDGRLEMIWPEYKLDRSQDLPEAYHDAGQFYCAHTALYKKKRSFSMKGVRPIVIPKYLVQDIDTLEDWKRAEFIFKAIQAEREAKML